MSLSGTVLSDSPHTPSGPASTSAHAVSRAAVIPEFSRGTVSRGKRWAVISLVLCAVAYSQGDLPAASSAASDVVSAESIPGSWPSFRGPGANGHADDAHPPLTWSVEDGENVLWKTEVPKPGMSSPVVWENRLFLTGADQASREVYCFDTDTGELLWKHDLSGIPGSPAADELPDVTETSGLAAPTATTNGRYVAAIFATGELVGLNMEGERIWARNLGVPKNPYGHASSLLSHEDLLFVQYDQEEDSKLLAFEFASGNPVWEAKREVISWSSPILVDNKGRMELILTNSEAIDSYDAQSGRLLWNVRCLTGEVAPSAAYADGVVYVANEYAAASAIEVGDHGSEPKVLWQWADILPDVASPLATADYVVLPSGYGIVTCLNAKTGEVLWEHEFDYGFYSSPILVEDRVYLIDRSGAMHVIRMDDKFELLGTSELGERAYATPAFVADRIYIRGAAHLFCIGEQNGDGI